MEDPTPIAPNGLREYLQILRRRKWTIIVTAVVFVGASLVYSALQTHEYEATAQLELTPQVSSAVLQANSVGSDSAAAVVDVPTDTQVLQSRSIASEVKAKLPKAPSVSVSQVGTTDVVNLSVRSDDPKLAAAATNLYAKTYVDFQQYESVVALTKAENIVQTHVDSLQSQINVLNQQALAATGSDLQSLQSRINTLEQTQGTLDQQISQYQTAASLTTGGGNVVSTAQVPTSPVSPKPVEYAIIAVVVGLLVGTGIALLKDHLDEGIRSLDDLEQVLDGVPPLGVVPGIGNWRERETPYLVGLAQPKAPASEAYRSIRTSIQFLALDRSLKTLQVTSPKSYDGKTTTIANLAVTTAEAGQRVVVVDCDLRRPRLHSFFGLSNAIGFNSVLLGQAQLEDAVEEIRGVPPLRVLTAGPIPPNPSELLSGQGTKDLLHQLSDRYDLVLIDSPPVLPVTDAVALSAGVDATVLIASVGNSSRGEVSRAITSLRRVGAPLCGFILNRAREEDTYAYYRYYYSSDEHEVNGSTSKGGNGQRPAHSPSSRVS